MDDLNLDDIEKEVNQKNVVEERIKNLVTQKKEFEIKAEMESKARVELETKAKEMERERDFFASFSDSVAKNPAAAEYRDKIKEKVIGGYSMEDATIAVLHSEGKLIPKSERVEMAAGGSAPTQLSNQSPKSTQDMTQVDRLTALREAEKRGELFMS